jgi:hypothetical protein
MILILSVGILRLSQKDFTYIPAQVPIDARNSSKGDGAEFSPPCETGWSVFIEWSFVWAVTNLPPSSVIYIGI